MRAALRHRLLLVGAAALFSTGGAAIKMASLTPWQVASFRSAIAAGALLAFLPEARRWSWRLLPTAAAYAATMILFVVSTRATTAANAIFLQSTAPLYLLLLGPLVLHERIRRSDVVFVSVVGAGMLLLFLDAQTGSLTAPRPRLGNLTAAASGLTWALTVTGLRHIGRTGDVDRTLATVAMGSVLAAAVTLAAALPLPAIHAADLTVVLYLGICQIGLAYIFLSRAILHVPAFEATTVLLLEPVLNPVWAWLAQGETPGRGALAGGAVILSATAINALLSRKDR